MTAEVDEGIGGVSRLARLISLGRLAPGGLADAPFALAAAAAVRVVHRIHCHAPRLLKPNEANLDRKPKPATNQSGNLPSHVYSPCSASAQSQRPKDHERSQERSPGQIKRILGRGLCLLCSWMAAASSCLLAGQEPERTSKEQKKSLQLG